MIKRLLLVLVGVAAAAVMLAAATDAVELADSTIEDGDSRWILVAGGAVVFLACVFWLIADLAAARRTKAVDEIDEGEPDPTAGPRSLADRLTVKSPIDAGATTIQRVPITVTQPPTTTGEPALSSASSGSRLFDPAAQRDRASQAGGLFGDRASGPTPPALDIPTAPPELPAETAVASEPSASPEATRPPIFTTPTPPPTPTATPTPPPPADSQPIALRDYDPDDIDRTIDEHQRVAVDSLVASGTLSTEGPLTADDIRTMLFIALSSEQLRSILHEARHHEPIARIELRDAAGSASQTTPPVAVEPGRPAVAHPDDRLPRWQVVDDRGAAAPEHSKGEDPDPGDEDPPSTGHLYATGGN